MKRGALSGIPRSAARYCRRKLSSSAGRVEFSEPEQGILTSGALSGATSVYPYALELENVGNVEFVKQFEKKFKEKPNTQSYEAYTAAYVVADATKRAGSADPAAIRDALETTDFKTILGDAIKFDDHHQAHGGAVILKVDGAKVVVDGFFGT